MRFSPLTPGRTRCRSQAGQAGQATLEFLILFPLLFSLFLLALAIASVWHGHHLSAALSLEAASRESVLPGAGCGFVAGPGTRSTRATRWSVEIAPAGSHAGQVPAQRLSVLGRAAVPWAPFGLRWDVPLRATTLTPRWTSYR
jgi:hypothetical protein